MSESYVLDASAILCLLQDEKGADRVASALPNAQLSAVNYAEVVGKLVEAALDDAKADSLIEALQLKVIPFDRAQARLAGSLRRPTPAFGLSLGDRSCLALARVQNAIALTCEKSWARFDAGCRVELAR